MAAKLYFRTGLTGGDSGDLDGIDGAILSDGDGAIVVDYSNALIYFYAVDSDSGASEDSPDVIEPDNNADDKRWLLQGIESDDIEIDTVTHKPLSSDPADPSDGHSVQWISDGTGSGDVGDVMMKINVGGTVKTVTLVDYSAE